MDTIKKKPKPKETKNEGEKENSKTMGNLIIGFFTIITCSTLAFFLHKIWLQKNEEVKKGAIDETKIVGIKYFSYALQIWVVSGLLTAFYELLAVEPISEELKYTYRFFRTTLSITNSALILLAIPSIEVENPHPNEFFRSGKDYKHVIGYAILIFIGTLVLTIFAGSLELIDWIEQPDYLISFFELVFAFLVMWDLMWRMIEAFKDEKRQMGYMIGIAWIAIILIFLAEALEIVPAFFGNEFPKNAMDNPNIEILRNSFKVVQPVVLLSYKTLFIFLIIILLYSWQVKKNKENLDELQRGNEKPIDEETTFHHEVPPIFRPGVMQIEERDTNFKIVIQQNGNNGHYLVKIENQNGLEIDFQKSEALFKRFLAVAVLTKKGKEAEVLDTKTNDRASLSVTQLDDQDVKRIRQRFTDPFHNLVQVGGRKGKLNLPPEMIEFENYNWDNQKDAITIINELFALYQMNR